MKKIRKLFVTAVLLAICVCCIVPFAACGDGWEEVQSITYKTNSSSKTLYSKCIWDITYQDILKEEFDNAPDKDKQFTNSQEYPWMFNPNSNININRKDFINISNKNIGLTVYLAISYGNEDYEYKKVTYNSYTLNYVKIKFNSDNSIEINYDGETTKVLPLSYEVSYFED